MQITQLKVYDMPEALVASGLPMITWYDESEFEREVFKTQTDLNAGGTNKHIDRAIRLASAPDGSGHKTFMSGIMVAMNITATMKWWVQFQRYHFQQIDSSMSTMHKLKDMADNGTIKFHPSTDKQMIDEFMMLCATSDDIEEIAYSVPSGIELTARVNTNYLQLSTMYKQRHNHRLSEWHQFCSMVQTLPLADKLIIGESNGAEAVKPGTV